MANPLDPAVLSNVLAVHVSWAKVVSAVDAILPPDIQGANRRDYIQRLDPDHVNDTPQLYRALVADLVARNQVDNFALALFNQAQDNLVLREVLQSRIGIDADGQVTDKAALQSLRDTVEPFLNSRNFFQGMEAARYRVCAVWVDGTILGTGFLIAPDLVMTARHVLDKVVQPGVATSVGGQIVAGADVEVPGSSGKLAFVFDYWQASANFDLTAPPYGVTIVKAAPVWLAWSSVKHPKDGISHVFGAPNVQDCLDCAIVRLERRVGATVASNSGGRMRGWLQLDAGRDVADGSKIAILQHPAGGAQAFDSGSAHSSDPAKSRIWYETNTAGGSSGSPCFDSAPSVVAFHNAGYPTQFQGPTKLCNQGVRIDRVVPALKTQPALLEASGAPMGRETALWSLSDPPALPVPVLGREDFQRHLADLYELDSSQRILVVEQHPDMAGRSNSGRRFSIRILKAVSRARSGSIAEFTAQELRAMAPEQFLLELGRRLGIAQEALATCPEKPQEERQAARWWAVDLPRWFGSLLEARGRSATAGVLETAGQPAADPAAASALGRDVAVRELTWIVIDGIDKHPLEGGMKELVAGMMAITDTDPVVAPGLKSLRWLVIGHVPDFVRERSIEYRRDEVSQLAIAEPDWVECLRTAWLANGKTPADFPENTAQTLYKFYESISPAIGDAEQRLPELARVFPNALTVLKP